MNTLTLESKSTAKTRPLSRAVRLLAVITAAATLLTLFARHHWLADLLANLRMQQVIGSVFILLLAAWTQAWRWTIVILLCCCIHLPWFYRDISQKPVGEGTPQASIRVLLANVLSMNNQHDRVIEAIQSSDPDFFAILELNTRLDAKLSDALQEDYRYRFTFPDDESNFGIGLYSKHPLLKTESFTLSTQIVSISAVAQIEGNSYRVYATHPLPPMNAEYYRLRNEHLEQLAERISMDSASEPTLPVILVGDLNLTPWSPHFATFEQASHLRRAVTGWNLTPTWYRFPAFPFGLVLDHAFISEHLICNRHQVGSDMGSDHRPVVVELSRLQ